MAIDASNSSTVQEIGLGFLHFSSTCTSVFALWIHLCGLSGGWRGKTVHQYGEVWLSSDIKSCCFLLSHYLSFQNRRRADVSWLLCSVSGSLHIFNRAPLLHDLGGWSGNNYLGLRNTRRSHSHPLHEYPRFTPAEFWLLFFLPGSITDEHWGATASEILGKLCKPQEWHFQWKCF